MCNTFKLENILTFSNKFNIFNGKIAVQNFPIREEKDGKFCGLIIKEINYEVLISNIFFTRLIFALFSASISASMIDFSDFRSFESKFRQIWAGVLSISQF